MSIWEMIDKAEVESKERTLLPEGNYKAVISDVTVAVQAGPLEGIQGDIEYTILDESHRGRKVWWSFKLDQNASPKKLAFVKSQIMKIANVTTTSGRPMDLLIEAKGNEVEIEVKHQPGVKDPSKTYLNVYCQGPSKQASGEAAEELPF